MSYYVTHKLTRFFSPAGCLKIKGTYNNHLYSYILSMNNQKNTENSIYTIVLKRIKYSGVKFKSRYIIF